MRKKNQPACPCCGEIVCPDGCCGNSIYGPNRTDFSQPPWELLQAPTEFDPANCLLYTTGAGAFDVQIRGDVATPPGLPRTYRGCVTIKQRDFRYVKLQVVGITNNPYVIADLQTGTISSQDPPTGAAGVDDLGDGWYAVWLSQTATAADPFVRTDVTLHKDAAASQPTVTPGEGNHVGAIAVCRTTPCIERNCLDFPDLDFVTATFFGLENNLPFWELCPCPDINGLAHVCGPITDQIDVCTWSAINQPFDCDIQGQNPYNVDVTIGGGQAAVKYITAEIFGIDYRLDLPPGQKFICAGTHRLPLLNAGPPDAFCRPVDANSYCDVTI